MFVARERCECPTCEAPMRGALDGEGKDQPFEDGEVLVCGGCATAVRVTAAPEGNPLVALTRAEIRRLPFAVQRELQNLRRALTAPAN